MLNRLKTTNCTPSNESSSAVRLVVFARFQSVEACPHTYAESPENYQSDGRTGFVAWRTQRTYQASFAHPQPFLHIGQSWPCEVPFRLQVTHLQLHQAHDLR